MAENTTDTVFLDPRTGETSFEYERLYQTYCLEEKVYCVPVDEVRTFRERAISTTRPLS